MTWEAVWLTSPALRFGDCRQFCTGPRIAVMCLLLWLVLGVTFYSQHNGWSLDKAFYYLVQSGACDAVHPTAHSAAALTGQP